MEFKLLSKEILLLDGSVIYRGRIEGSTIWVEFWNSGTIKKVDLGISIPSLEALECMVNGIKETLKKEGGD